MRERLGAAPRVAHAARAPGAPRSRRAPPARAARGGPSSTSSIWLPTVEHRVEAAARVLEHHAHAPAAYAGALPLRAGRGATGRASVTSPSTTAFSGSRPARASRAVLLPEPLSPTSARIRPRSTRRSMPSTARTSGRVPVARPEADPQAADLERGRGRRSRRPRVRGPRVSGHERRWGASRPPSASPSRLTDEDRQREADARDETRTARRGWPRARWRSSRPS